MSGHVGRIIARIPTMPARERAEWREKAERVLARRPGDGQAQRILAALDAAAETIAPRRLISTGALAWEPHDPDTPSCRGFAGDRPVARILKHATHTAMRKAVYAVELLGTPLPGRFDHIEAARQAGERAWQELQGPGDAG